MSCESSEVSLATTALARAFVAILATAWSSVSIGAADDRLVQAVRRGDIAAVGVLAKDRTLVNAPQADGATPLHWAAHRDDLAVTDLLLKSGASPDAANDLGVTPLSLACTNGSAAIVARLLEAGANPNANGSRVPPLMTCAQTGNVNAVKALLAHNADANAKEPLRGQTALMWAAAQKHPEVVSALLARGADVRARSSFTRVIVNRADPNSIDHAVVGPVSRGGSTALLFAARSGDVDSATRLLRAGANVDDLMADGTSALTVAAHSGHLDLVQLLLAEGANPNIISSGYTALHAAVLRGNLEMAKTLVARGANIDARLRHGTPTLRGSRDYVLPDSLTGATPLWLAAKYLEVDIVRWLLDRGADPAAALRDGTTMLMAAAGVGSQTKLFDRRDRVALLRDSDETRALAVSAILLARGTDVNAINEAADTALHGAAAMSYPVVANALIERGARTEARNKKGETPFEVATGDAVRNLLRELAARPR